MDEATERAVSVVGYLRGIQFARAQAAWQGMQR
jgi:hypothetical protein